MEGGDIVIKMAIEMGREDVINYGPSTCYQDGIKEGALASRLRSSRSTLSASKQGRVTLKVDKHLSSINPSSFHSCIDYSQGPSFFVLRFEKKFLFVVRIKRYGSFFFL